MRVLSTAFILSLTTALFSQGWENVKISVEEVSQSVYLLKGKGGNIGVCIGEDGVLLIDDQFAPLSDKIDSTIKTLSQKELIYLINTHWHGDHTGGNENFAQKGATIIAHENVRTRLSTDQVRPFGPPTLASPPSAWPTLTFNEKMNVHFNGQDIHLIHIHNAHTDGDAFVYFSNANVLHMGDCFFNNRFPFIDREMGGSVNGAIKAVELAMMMIDEDTKIIPGHGDLADKSDLLRYYNMLITMRDRIKSVIKQNITEDQLNFDTLTLGYETWGEAYINDEKMVKTFYRDLKE